MGKYAVMINAATDDAHTSSAGNGIEYGLDLAKAGHEVEIYFDGSATRWPDTLKRNPDHPVNKYYDEAMERDLIAGACEYCAHAYDAAETLEEEGIPLLGGATGGHGPDVGELASDGYELLTIG